MIVKSVVLGCSPARAFCLFTEHAGTWWPPERRHTSDAESEIRLESSEEFFERASDGREVELGVVRVFEPARRLILDWYPGSGREQPTRVEVRFAAVAGGTEITIVHGPGDGEPETFARNAPAYARSWDLVVSALAREQRAVS